MSDLTTASPHIAAKKSDVAKIVIMPGDPLRAKYIAENFLLNFKEINSVRNMLMYTGEYQGCQITIAGSGMGMPSIGIYSYELFKFYDVECIIRIGSAGSYQSSVNVFDVINVTSCYSESTYGKVAAASLKTEIGQKVKRDIVSSSGAISDLIAKTAETIDNDTVDDVAKINLKSGIVHSSDVFYRFSDNNKQNPIDLLNNQAKNCLCVEMESFALFTNAILLNKTAGCILTISDSLITGQTLSSELRQKGFQKMMNLALKSAVNYLKR